MGSCDCDPNMVLAMPPPRDYVRLTVCVELDQVAPNCLQMFGFDLTGQLAQFTTIMRHELP